MRKNTGTKQTDFFISGHKNLKEFYGKTLKVRIRKAVGGGRLEIIEELIPELHPEGDFDAVLYSVDTGVMTQNRPGLIRIIVRFETSCGKVIGAVFVYLSSLRLVHHALEQLVGESFRIRIKHDIFEDKKFVRISRMDPVD